jgi:hypothetical protein
LPSSKLQSPLLLELGGGNEKEAKVHLLLNLPQISLITMGLQEWRIGSCVGHFTTTHKDIKCGPAPVAYTFNPSYSGGRDQEDHSLRPAGQIVLETLSWKYPTQKWTGRVTQVGAPA